MGGFSDFFNNNGLGYLLGAYLGQGIKERMDNKALKDSISSMAMLNDQNEQFTNNLKNSIGNNTIGAQDNAVGNIVDKYYGKPQQQDSFFGQNYFSQKTPAQPNVTGNSQEDYFLSQNPNILGNTNFAPPATPSVPIARPKETVMNNLLQKNSTRDMGVIYKLLNEGKNLNTIKSVLGMDQNRRSMEQQEAATRQENDRQAAIQNIVNDIYDNKAKGDINTANALVIKLLPLLKSDTGGYNNWIKATQPDITMKDTDTGGFTYVTKYDKTGQLPIRTAIVKNSVSPNEELKGKVSLTNNASDNITRRDIADASNRTQRDIADARNKTQRDITIQKIIAAANKKQEGKEEKIPAVYLKVNNLVQQMHGAVNNGNAEQSGEAIDTLKDFVSNNKENLDDGDIGNINNEIYVALYRRAIKANSKQEAEQYYKYIPDYVKEMYGI